MHLSINIGLDTLKNNDLNLHEVMILAIIYSYERNEKPCLLKRDKMAQYLNIGQATLERYYKHLKDAKWLFINRKCKKLTNKAIAFCQSFMAYKVSSKKKKKQFGLPKWYEQYQESLKQEKNKPSELVEMSDKELAELFGED